MRCPNICNVGLCHNLLECLMHWGGCESFFGVYCNILSCTVFLQESLSLTFVTVTRTAPTVSMYALISYVAFSPLAHSCIPPVVYFLLNCLLYCVTTVCNAWKGAWKGQKVGARSGKSQGIDEMLWKHTGQEKIALVDVLYLHLLWVFASHCRHLI